MCVEFQVQFYESKAWQFAPLSAAAVAGEEWKFSIFHRSILRNQSDMSSSSLLLFYFHPKHFFPLYVCCLSPCLFSLLVTTIDISIFLTYYDSVWCSEGEIQWAQMRVNVNEHGGEVENFWKLNSLENCFSFLVRFEITKAKARNSRMGGETRERIGGSVGKFSVIEFHNFFLLAVLNNVCIKRGWKEFVSRINFEISYIQQDTCTDLRGISNFKSILFCSPSLFYIFSKFICSSCLSQKQIFFIISL